MYNNIKYKFFIIDICVGRKVSQYNSKNITDYNFYNYITGLYNILLKIKVI